MSKLILYSTNCPKCKVVKMKLNQKHIDFDENTNVDEMMALGITHAPMLGIDGKLLDFSEAIKYINEYKEDSSDGKKV